MIPPAVTTSKTDGAQVSLLLGVTAHRDIPPSAEPALRNAVRELIQEYRTRFANTPITVVSAFAEGGDSLCVEVALECGANVVAALPFPPNIYRMTSAFSSDASRDKFNELLRHDSVAHFVAPLPSDLEEESRGRWSDFASDPKARRLIYSENGNLIVRYSHALIALWDGTSASAPGGTSEIVRSRIHGIADHVLEERNEFRWPHPGVVHHIWCPRDSNPSLQFATGTRRDIWQVEDTNDPGPRLLVDGKPSSMEKEHWAICSRIDRLNRRLTHSVPVADARLWEKFSSCTPPTQPRHSVTQLRHVALFRELSAQLSRELSRQIRSGLRLAFGLALVAVLALTLYDRVSEESAASNRHEPVWLLTFLLALAICTGVIRWVRKLETEELDYRTLAEALRTACQWGYSGIDASVADHYLQQSQGEVSWTRNAVQSITFPPPAFNTEFSRLSAEQQLLCLNDVRQCWLKEQLNYFSTAKSACHARSRRCRRIGFTMVMAGWALAAAPFLGASGSSFSVGFATVFRSVWTSAEHPIDAVSTAAGLLVVCGALILAFGERRLYDVTGRFKVYHFGRFKMYHPWGGVMEGV